jgi:hypothetical protein
VLDARVTCDDVTNQVGWRRFSLKVRHPSHPFSRDRFANPSGFMVGIRKRWASRTRRVARSSLPLFSHSHSASLGRSILFFGGVTMEGGRVTV